MRAQRDEVGTRSVGTGEAQTRSGGRLGAAFSRAGSSMMLTVGGTLLIGIAFMALIGPEIARYEPLAIAPPNRLQGPTSEHWFGTDTFGRDVLSRVVTGGRVSLQVGLAVALLSGIVGVVVAMYSAYYPLVDTITMRIIDGMMAFPAILLAIALAAVMGGGMVTLILALTVVYAPRVARVARSVVLSVKEEAFIDALRAQGAGSSRIMWINTLPNVVPAMTIQLTFVFADALLVEAALSFIGLGVPAPAPSWGNMLLEGKQVIYQAWWLIVFPGMAISLLILSINLVGDGLRDVIDPRYVGKGKQKAQTK